MKLEPQQEVILGVDTHLDVHVGVVISEIGQLLGTRSVSATSAGYSDLLSWASSFGTLTRAGIATATPKQQSGACEAMRIISVARRSAVKAKTQAINQLRALLVSAPQDIREKLWRAKTGDCVKACAKVRNLGDSVLLQALA